MTTRSGRRRRAVLTGLLVAPLATTSAIVGYPPAPTVARAEPMPSGSPDGSDFDGDSYADLILGTGRTAYVLYGSPTGLRTNAARLSRFTVDEVAGRDTTRDTSFGSTALGDFDGDSYVDVAIWIEDNSSKRNVHGVHVVYGSAYGLDLTRTVFRPFPRRNSAAALASGNFGRGRCTDLAVSYTNFRIGKSEVGAVQVLYGSMNGLGTDLETWHQDSPGVLGTAEHYQDFGASLIADDFGRSRYDDLAIGITSEGATEEGDTPGGVQVLYGSAGGLTASGNQLFDQNTAGLRTPRWGTSYFGEALASGHFAGREYADLAIGSQYTQVLEDLDPLTNEEDRVGTVNVLYGSADGLTLVGNQLWTQNGRRIKGRVGPFGFGGVLVAANFGKDRGNGEYDDLAIGAWMDGPPQAPYGAFHVLYGSPGGLTSSGDQRLHQGKRGVPGVREDFDGFGRGLAAADFGRADSGRRYADLAVASSAESLYGVDDAGRVHVFFGSESGITVSGVQVWNEQVLGARIRSHSVHADGLGTLLVASG